MNFNAGVSGVDYPINEDEAETEDESMLDKTAHSVHNLDNSEVIAEAEVKSEAVEKVENEEAVENVEQEESGNLIESVDEKVASELFGESEGEEVGNVGIEELLDESKELLSLNDDKDTSGIDGQLNSGDTIDGEHTKSTVSDKDSERKHGAASPSSERFKRKAKPPRKKVEGDMIAEEDTEDGSTTRSPGPPPLESVSQNLDDYDDRYKRNELEYLQPGTPERLHIPIDEEQEEMIEEEEEEIKLTRDEIIAKYQAALEEKERYQSINNQLHHKLADYLRKRKSDDVPSQSLFDKASQDQEQRYIKYLNQIEELHKQLEKQRDIYENEKYELKEKCEYKQKQVNEERAKYIKLKKDIALKAISSQTGKSVHPKEIEAYLTKEQQKEQEVIQVRLENIKLKNQLKKKENQLKAKEELGDGLHLIDFEQLKIENQTYNEKIEERNEELMKLKKKINNTVQILTHVKEKLKFVSAENEKEKEKLSVFDEEVKKKRDILNHIKQSRDSLRIDNNRLKQNSGLLGNTKLLRDFEECVDKNERLQSEIEQLKRRHAELILDSKGLKKKITQVKIDK